MIFKNTVKSYINAICVIMLAITISCGSKYNPIYVSHQQPSEPGLPGIKLDTLKNHEIIRYTYMGVEIIASLDIESTMDNNQLDSFLDSVYYLNKKNPIDINGLAYYCILFNEELNISEVRILKRYGFEKKDNETDSIIIKSIRSTEGFWKNKSENHCKWYIYISSFNVR